MVNLKLYCNWILLESVLSILFLVSVVFWKIVFFPAAFLVCALLFLIFFFRLFFRKRNAGNILMFMVMTAVCVMEALIASSIILSERVPEMLILVLFSFPVFFLALILFVISKSVFLCFVSGSYVFKLINIVGAGVFIIALIFLFSNLWYCAHTPESILPLYAGILIFTLLCQVVSASRINARAE